MSIRVNNKVEFFDDHEGVAQVACVAASFRKVEVSVAMQVELCSETTDNRMENGFFNRRTGAALCIG